FDTGKLLISGGFLPALPRDIWRHRRGFGPMAKVSTKTAAKADTPIFTPTPEAKAQATRSRIIALAMWTVAIVLELVAIFWVMRPSFDELAASQGFPQWRWYTLLGFIVVIGVLAI